MNWLELFNTGRSFIFDGEFDLTFAAMYPPLLDLSYLERFNYPEVI